MSLNLSSNSDEQKLSALGYQPVLARKLTLKYLIAFGLNYLQPIGPALIFGVLAQASGGSVALPYLVAFVGMLFTLYSYTILSKKYPLSGALYSYVEKVMGRKIGIIAGWLLLLDYILIPAITLASAAHYINALFPQINYEWTAVVLAFLLAVSNIVGIKFTATVSLIILLIEMIVVIIFLIMCAHWAIITPQIKLASFLPFRIDNLSALLSASAIAIFGYLGFDAISTLAEETKSPEKLLPKAMLICLIVGCIISFLTGYLGVLVVSAIPNLYDNDGQKLSSILFEVSRIIGGNGFSLFYALTFVIAMIATNIIGTASAARLLFGMGRDKIIYFNNFSKVHEVYKTPYYSIIFISLISIIIALFFSIEKIAELINYGALAGFGLLNLSAFLTIRKKRASSLMMFIPLVGMLLMLVLFVNLEIITLVFGSIWLIFGITFLFKKPLN